MRNLETTRWMQAWDLQVPVKRWEKWEPRPLTVQSRFTMEQMMWIENSTLQARVKKRKKGEQQEAHLRWDWRGVRQPAQRMWDTKPSCLSSASANQWHQAETALSRGSTQKVNGCAEGTEQTCKRRELRTTSVTSGKMSWLWWNHVSAQRPPKSLSTFVTHLYIEHASHVICNPDEILIENLRLVDIII